MTQGSYLLLEPGMKVRGADGADLGHIVDVASDESADIFRGIVVATGLFDRHSVFVPGEHVISVIADIVSLDLNRDDLAALEPASGVAA